MTSPHEQALAAETPMADHVVEFWRLLETETVRILVNIKRENEGMGVYWDSASFPDDVAKELVAARRPALPSVEGLVALSARLAEAERERDTKAKLYRQALRRAKAAEARASSLAAELNEARANVGNLLARIHRDGGHYAARHGTAKAVADADLIVAELFARKETPDAQ